MSYPRFTPFLIGAALGLAACSSPGRAAENSANYQTPSQVIADILTAPRVPRGAPSVSPDGARMILPELPSLIPIATLAEPVDKLAGLEILSAFHCTRPQIKSAWNGFSIVEIASGKKVRAQLPEGSRVGTVSWSTRGDQLACALYAPGGAEVWIVNAVTGKATKLEKLRLNTVTSSAIEWTLDDATILCTALPSGATRLPERNRIPDGPELRVGAGKPTPQRTARDVLRTADDQKRFELEATSQLVRESVGGGGPLPVGRSGVLLSWAVSPDDQFVVVDRIDSEPLGFPYLLFPRTIEIWGTDGHRAAVVGIVPFNDRSAISSVARLGPRGMKWAPDGRSLWFFSWQDTPGADPMKAIRDTLLPQPGTDRLMKLNAPFTSTPSVIASSDFQYQDMIWSADGKRLMLVDLYEPRRQARMAWIDPTAIPPIVTHVLARVSTERVYGLPGDPLTRRVAHGRILWMSDDGASVYLAGDGFRPDGQRPFLDAMNLKTGKSIRLFESAPDVLEGVVALLSADGKRFITLRQSNRTPPNYSLRLGKKAGIQLSNYSDPAPALTASKRMQFKFSRPDSVALNAEVVLPGDWKPGQKLPTIFWVYPNDYRSAAAASENRRSPNRFPSQSPLNPEVLVTQGYAVVYPDLAIVGTNDRYVDEVRLSARAAIDECARRGFCDPKRVGVGGHSYGAFSTANLLAHTDLFKAGIASDGAYNRTLTPFTFQAEERTLWQAPDTYLKMSPFLHADQIKAPLLLLHNLDDTNVGTNPIQSERMFEALNGLGKVVSLVEYPYEDHGPVGRETVLDYWARVTEWFDRYVKNADGESKATVGAAPAPDGRP